MSSVESIHGGWQGGVNPYASPESRHDGNAERIEIWPRHLPRDAWDVLITAGFVLLIIPAGLCLWGVLNYPWKMAMVPPLVFLGVLLPASYALAISVRRLTIDQMGIEIHRGLGGPRFLHWEQVRRISLASREEVLLKGYLLPPMPAKAIMNTTSYLGHYRIEWEGGVFYFPPIEAEPFLAAVQRWRGECLGESIAAAR